MEKNEVRKPNYKNKKRKKVQIVDKKKFVLALLVATIGISSSLYGMKEGISNSYDYLKDTIVHNSEMSSYRKLVNKNCHVTNDRKNYFIDTYELAQDVKNLDVSTPKDVYHHLIGIASNIDYNRNENFRTFLNSYDLDKLSQDDIAYPTYQEFSDFLFEHGLINEEGNINFEKWRSYDKEVYNFEKDLANEYKSDIIEGKSL